MGEDAIAARTSLRALEGIRVIDASTFLAGPHCATLMAEFGAEVIKVEMPGLGDSLRQLGMMKEGTSLWWRVEARNKKTITLDLRKPAGKDLLKRLVDRSDVLIENFRPGTLEKWGLGWEDLHIMKPGLVMLRISAFGQTGPNKDRPGFARIAMAFSGLTYLTGFPDRPPANPGTTSLADYLTGVYGAFGVMAALRHRDLTGVGQYIDIGLYESVFRILEDVAIVYDQTGISRERVGSMNHGASPHDHYRCGDGQYIALACSNDTMFRRLCEAMGQPETANRPEFTSNPKRVENRSAVDNLVTEWLARWTAEEALRILQQHEVPAGPIYSMAGIFEDEHYQARQNIVTVGDQRLGSIRMSGVVPRLSLTPGRVEHGGRDLGQDNEAIYGEVLGLTESEIEDLRTNHVI
jgi:succinyl-CoA:(S)-malate CoA-transferase subunit A/succinyl-CoA:(S)-malate CoA-transferase subunit B